MSSEILMDLLLVCLILNIFNYYFICSLVSLIFSRIYEGRGRFVL